MGIDGYVTWSGGEDDGAVEGTTVRSATREDEDLERGLRTRDDLTTGRGRVFTEARMLMAGERVILLEAQTGATGGKNAIAEAITFRQAATLLQFSNKMEL